MSLEWVWRFSKLSPNSLQAHIFFISHLFLGEKRNEFGVSLEIFQTLSKLISNPLQTQMISFFRVFFLYCFFFHVCSNDLGVGLEIIQTLSKPAPNSYVFIFSVVIFFSIYILFWTRGMSLEWVWRFSKLAPNSYVFIFSVFMLFSFYFTFLEKRNDILPEYVISGPICSM
jgi:hypothetical protein